MLSTIETLKDALGNEVFRVSRIFPNSSSAHRGAISLDEINPDGFEAKKIPCRKELAQGQYFSRCGEVDFGFDPALCTECGGTLRLLVSPFAKGEAFDPPEVFPPNCDGHQPTAGEYMAQLQADSAEGDLDPRAVQAGIEGAGT